MKVIRSRRQRGLTLVEMVLILVVVMVVLGGIAASLVRSSTRGNKTCKELIDEANAAQADCERALASGSPTVADVAGAIDHANSLMSKAKGCLAADTNAIALFDANRARINQLIAAFSGALNPEDAATFGDRTLRKP
jgi:type II secretory pathway pseudopilin PulG